MERRQFPDFVFSTGTKPNYTLKRSRLGKLKYAGDKYKDANPTQDEDVQDVPDLNLHDRKRFILEGDPDESETAL